MIETKVERMIAWEVRIRRKREYRPEEMPGVSKKERKEQKKN